MNIFEGSRRIAKVFAAVVVLGTLIGLYQHSPNVVLRYSVHPGGWTLLDAPDDCRIGIDGIDGDDFTTRNGHSFHRSFCFLATKSDQGALLVPYKAVGETLLLNQPFSEEVKSHMGDFLSKHPPDPKDFDKADREYRSLLIAQWSYGIGALIAGLLIYWAAIWTIGWIVRGFLSIPRGHDSRSPVVEQDAAASIR